MVFKAQTRVLSIQIDRDGAASPHGWEQVAGYGLGGSGGLLANRDWGLSPEHSFSLHLSAYSEGATVSTGQVWVDNFKLSIPPRITIVRDGGQVRLRWPASSVGYQLLKTADLREPSWSFGPSTPRPVEEHHEVVIPFAAGSQFFKLTKVQ